MPELAAATRQLARRGASAAGWSLAGRESASASEARSDACVRPSEACSASRCCGCSSYIGTRPRRSEARFVEGEPPERLQLREVARVDGQPRGDARRVARPRQPSRRARCAQQGELLVVRHDARASLGRDAQQRQGPAAEEVPEEGAQAQSQHQVPLLVRANKDGGDVLPAHLDGHLVVQRGLRPLATSVLPHGVPAVRLLVGGAEPFEGGEA